MKWTGACATYIGNTRKVNQDAIWLGSTKRGGAYFIVLAVCDGIGGLERGEVASSLVIEHIREWYVGLLQWMDISTVDPDVLHAHLKDAAEEWNRVVCAYREQYQVRTGTTLSLLMLIRDRYYTLQIGDSRIYGGRGDSWRQLTADDSVTRTKNGRTKSYLDNFVGKQGDLRFSSTGGIVQAGDLFLVCSDGLYRRLQAEDLREIGSKAREWLRDEAGAEAVCRELIGRMLQRGESDNISVGIVAGRKKLFEGRG